MRRVFHMATKNKVSLLKEGEIPNGGGHILSQLARIATD